MRKLFEGLLKAQGQSVYITIEKQSRVIMQRRHKKLVFSFTLNYHQSWQPSHCVGYCSIQLKPFKLKLKHFILYPIYVLVYDMLSVSVYTGNMLLMYHPYKFKFKFKFFIGITKHDKGFTNHKTKKNRKRKEKEHTQ